MDGKDELDESDDASTTKRVSKKKHYPFGTPSHLHHPYSQFSHLAGSTKAFAEDLAKATGIEAQVLEEKQPRRRRIPPKAPKKEGDEEDDESAAADAIPPDLEGEEPCTRLPCQLVLRAIMDLQIKNQIERLEIEDEYDRLMEELKLSEQDIVTTEAKLEKLNEIGNSLEGSANMLASKVEGLEKTRDALNTERTEINNKTMIIESERQKFTRRLEQAQKALSDAMWRKKKAAQDQNIADGVSLATSIISDYGIIHSDAKTISDANSVSSTPYNRLARDKGMVADYIERPPTVKVMPPHIVDKMIKNKNIGTAAGAGHSLQEAAIDKYSRKHYQTMVEACKQSWEAQGPSIVASNVHFYKNKPGLFAQGGGGTVGGLGNNMSGSVGSLHGSSVGFGSPGGGSVSSIDDDDMRSVVFGTTTTHMVDPSTISSAALRVGNYLQTRSNLTNNPPTLAKGTLTAAYAQYDCTNTTLRLNRSLSTLTPIHKKQSIQQTKKIIRRTDKNIESADQDLNNSGSIRLTPLNKNDSQGRGGSQSGRNSPFGQQQQLNTSSSMSLMSGLTGGHDLSSQGALKSGRSGQGNMSGRIIAPTPQLSVQQHSDNFNNTFSDSTSLSSSLFQHASRLDPVFYKERARTSFARDHTVGKIRILERPGPDGQVPSVASSVKDMRKKNSSGTGAAKEGEKVLNLRERNAQEQLAEQQRNMLHRRALTTKHHGMETFHDSITIR